MATIKAISIAKLSDLIMMIEFWQNISQTADGLKLGRWAEKEVACEKLSDLPELNFKNK